MDKEVFVQGDGNMLNIDDPNIRSIYVEGDNNTINLCNSKGFGSKWQIIVAAMPILVLILKILLS